MDPLSQPQNQNDDLNSTNNNAAPTTDSSSQDTTELDSLMNELNNYRPENDETINSADSNMPVSSRPNLAPSQDLIQAPTVSVASVSAPNTEPTSSPLVAGSPINTQNIQNNQNSSSTETFGSQTSMAPESGATNSVSLNSDSLVQDINDAAPLSSEESTGDSDNQDQPFQAAAPVPGSIGSAVSYADVEKKQAEEALKQAQNQGKPKFKFTRTTILIIIIAALLVISGIVVALIFLSQPKKIPSEATGKNQVTGATTKTLTCVRPLNTNETAEVSASYGNFERQFNFDSDNLDTITESYIYQFDSSEAATAAKNTLDSAPKTDSNLQYTTSVSLNQLRKTSTIFSAQLDNYLKSQTELNSVTSRDLNSFLAAENQSGLSCSTIE